MTISLRAFLTPLQRLIQIIPPAQFTLEAKAWIAAHPVVRACAAPHQRPFKFRKCGKVVGVVSSYLDAIPRIGGLRVEYVDNVSWANSYPAFMSGKIDMAPDASRSADISRYRIGTIVSLPQFAGTMVVVAPEPLNLFVDLENLAGKQIATKGSGDSNMRSDMSACR